MGLPKECDFKEADIEVPHRSEDEDKTEPVPAPAWPIDLMKQSWVEDQEDADWDSSDYRQLRDLKTSLNVWIEKNGGGENVQTWDSMTKVTADGKVRKRLVYPGTEGSGGKGITEGMFVRWQYTAFVEPNFVRIIDATRFNGRREVFRVDKVDASDMIQRGLRLGVATMQLGETAHFRIHPDYAFGGRGVPPRIPANAVMHYIVEIDDEEVDDRKASNKFLRQQVDNLMELGLDACLQAAYEFRERGVAMFQKHLWEMAKENFDDGIRAVNVCRDILNEPYADQTPAEEVETIGKKLRLNSAVTNAKLSNWTEVVALTSPLVEADGTSIKALYFLALAKFHLKKFEESLVLASRGSKLRRGCPEFAELYAKLVKFRVFEEEKEKKFCRRMFFGAQLSKAKGDRWTLVGEDVRKHVKEEIAKLTTDGRGFTEVPLNYILFIDQLNLSYLEDQAKQAGLRVDIKQGKVRNIVRLMRAT